MLIYEYDFRPSMPLLPCCQKHKARPIFVISFIENDTFIFCNAVASGSVSSHSSLGHVQYLDSYKELLDSPKIWVSRLCEPGQPLKSFMNDFAGFSSTCF
jgi:hypothetical protein